MTKRTYAEPVGWLIGKIHDAGNVLVIVLLENPAGRIITRCYEQYDTNDPHKAALKTALDLEQQVINVWQNGYDPPWFYIQLDSEYPAHALNMASLPWSVYREWRIVKLQSLGGE